MDKSFKHGTVILSAYVGSATCGWFIVYIWGFNNRAKKDIKGKSIDSLYVILLIKGNFIRTYEDRKDMLNQINYGIDLLRIIAMFFVVVLHTLGHGGVLGGAEMGTMQYSTSWALEIIAYPAVDIFALITGYVNYSQNSISIAKIYSRLVITWLQVVYYCFFITFFMWIINSDWVTYKDFEFCLLPVSVNAYWYFTAFAGVILLSPIIKAGIQSMTKKATWCLFATILCFFSIYTILNDYFTLNGGYTVIWLLLLYIEGAIMKKIALGLNFSTIKIVILIIFLYVITWFWKLYAREINLWVFTISPDSLVSYTSPTILGIAILFVILFSKLHINKQGASIIRFLAPGAFSVYLLNDHSLFQEHFIENRFSIIVPLHCSIIVSDVILFASMFTIIALVVDKPRQMVFRKLALKKKAYNALHRIIPE